MKFFRKALSFFLTAAIITSMVFTGAISAGAESASEFQITRGSNDDGTYCIQITTDNFFMIDLTAERLTDHNITVEYFCKSNTYKFSLDYIDRFPYPVFHINDEFFSNKAEFDYNWNTTWVNNQAINSDIYLYAKTDDYIKDLRTCSSIRITCSDKKNSRVVLVDETIALDPVSDAEDKDTDEKDDEIKDISSLTISKPSDYTYTGNVRKAVVVIKDGSYILKKGTDYTLSYKNCKDIGTATVTIKGKGNYTGKKTLSYKILPGKTTTNISKKSNSKIVISWSAVKGAEKYQIYYTENGGKFKKLATVSGKKTAVTLSGLNLKKNVYSFRVRAVTENDGTKYYGPFSVSAHAK